MLDYSVLLNDKTKRRVLMDEFEDQKNRIQYFIDEHEPEEAVPLLEKLVETMDTFLTSNLPQENEQ